ncbi:MAG: TIGR04211 family SH3 domain-containing protein [Thermodesulfobacteriota bacterium]
MIRRQSRREISLLPAISLFLFLSTIFLTPLSLSAETRYVAPTAELAVRRGQGLDYKIIAMVKDGAAVELLEENDSYARIRLSNNKEGWILKRFLKTSPPPTELVASLQREKEDLQARELDLSQKVEELSASLAQTRTELDTTLQERDRILTELQSLQRDTADVIRIKKETVKTRKENQQLAGELSAVKENSEQLKKNFAIKWFLAGGGVLLLGMFIGGAMSGRSRKRKSLQL